MIQKQIFPAAFCALVLVLVAAQAPLRAQGTGPMQPAESQKFPTPPPPAKPEPPALPPDEIIRRFAAKEDEMVRAIKGYTCQKEVRFQEISPEGRPAGQIDIVTELQITTEGKMYEKPVSRQPSTLHYVNLERGDSQLLAPAPMFPLTTAMLPKYDIAYGGKQPLDELSAYYFTVKPRGLERTHAYFSGVIWVDTQDFVIVKMIGKWVTDTGDITAADVPFTVFETYRQQVGKNFWFPAYSRSDDTMQVGNLSVPVRITVKWSDYKADSTAPAADGKSAPTQPESK